MTREEYKQDKVKLVQLVEALNASSSYVHRDECGVWRLRGRPGCYASTWGEEGGWLLVVVPETELSALGWSWAKKRLSFAEVTQDGDNEGCFRLHRLPSSDEAKVIRDILGFRKRIDFSPEELARRKELGRRLHQNYPEQRGERLLP